MLDEPEPDPTADALGSHYLERLAQLCDLTRVVRLGHDGEKHCIAGTADVAPDSEVADREFGAQAPASGEAAKEIQHGLAPFGICVHGATCGAVAAFACQRQNPATCMPWRHVLSGEASLIKSVAAVGHQAQGAGVVLAS